MIVLLNKQHWSRSFGSWWYDFWWQKHCLRGVKEGNESNRIKFGEADREQRGRALTLKEEMDLVLQILLISFPNF